MGWAKDFTLKTPPHRPEDAILHTMGFATSPHTAWEPGQRQGRAWGCRIRGRTRVGWVGDARVAVWEQHSVVGRQLPPHCPCSIRHGNMGRSAGSRSSPQPPGARVPVAPTARLGPRHPDALHTTWTVCGPALASLTAHTLRVPTPAQAWRPCWCRRHSYLFMDPLLDTWVISHVWAPSSHLPGGTSIWLLSALFIFSMAGV